VLGVAGLMNAYRLGNVALVNAVVCWSLCWVFWDRFEFSATLFGLGCFPIVVAVCAYLYLLTKKAEQA